MHSIPASATALALVLSPVAVHAQSSGGWSLPEPTATPTNRSQGPVDSQNPVVRPRDAAPVATPAPTLTPAPTPTPTLAPAPTPVTPPPVRPAPGPSADVSPQPGPTPRAAPVPGASAAPPPAPAAGAGAAAGAPAPEPQQPAASAPQAPEPGPGPGESWPSWWWTAALVLIAAIGGTAVLLRRRRAEPPQPEWADEQAAEPALQPPAPAKTPVAAQAQPEPGFAPPIPAATPAAPASAAVSLAFEPVGLRLSLVYATLRYRATITAEADLPAGQLLGDMIGAHGTIPPEEQLAPACETLTPLKPLPALAAGESVTLDGEIQLPLSAIRPVRQGNASLFVPLVRLALTAGDQALRRVFTVGLIGGPALAPLRLDTGPREHGELGAREVEAARAYPLRPPALRQAG